MIVIFDLDGTLVNTYPIIRKTFIEVISKHLPDLKYDEDLLKSFFGPTLYDSFYKITNDIKKANFLISEYRKINSGYYEKEVALFPNVIPALEKLKDKNKLVILSNRIQSLVEIALKVTKIDKYFDLVLGVDKIEKPKPYPDGIYQILEYYKIEDAIFIGDALTDIYTAKNAKILSMGVTWAHTTKTEFIEANADYIVNSFEELIKILEEINV